MSITKKRALEIANNLERSSHLVSQKEMVRYGLELRHYILNNEPKRKIVQVVSNNGTLFALCNDGSLWRHEAIPYEKFKWHPHNTDIPQPE